MTSLAETIHIAEDKLVKVGVSPEQAKAQIEVISSFIDNQLVTKRDLDIKIAELKLELIKWMIGLGFAQIVFIAGLIKFIR